MNVESTLEARVAPVALTELLNRLRGELHELANQSLDLQDAISTAAVLNQIDCAAPFMKIQSLDKMSQTLFGLADYVMFLSAGVPSDFELDPGGVTAALKLSDLAQRLCNSRSESFLRLEGAGDCDHF